MNERSPGHYSQIVYVRSTLILIDWYVCMCMDGWIDVCVCHF